MSVGSIPGMGTISVISSPPYSSINLRTCRAFTSPGFGRSMAHSPAENIVCGQKDHCLAFEPSPDVSFLTGAGAIHRGPASASLEFIAFRRRVSELAEVLVLDVVEKRQDVFLDAIQDS